MPDPVDANEVDPGAPPSSMGDRPRSSGRHPLVRTMWGGVAVGIPVLVVVCFVLIANGVEVVPLVDLAQVAIGVVGLGAGIAALLGRFTRLGHAATVVAAVLASQVIAATIVVIGFAMTAVFLALYYYG